MATTLVGQTISSTFRQITHVDGGIGACMFYEEFDYNNAKVRED